MIDAELFPDEAADRQRLRLFCFPHAGGGTSQFYRWRRYAPETVAVVPARLSGREARLHQQPISSMAELATNIADTIRSLPAGPLALLGYSVGAYVAYQVALRLPRRGEHAPRGIVVAASNAPGTRKPSAGVSELPDEAFIDHIHNKHGGIPAIVRHDPSWRAAVIPSLRADLRMLETYQFEPAEPLVCPLLALGGSDDAHVSGDNLAAWSAVTRGTATTRQFAGGHFFLYPDFNAADARGSGPAASPAPAPLAAVFHFIEHSTLPTQ